MEAVVPFGLSKRKRESALSLSSTVSIVENLKVADMTMGDNQTSMKRTKSIVSRSNDSLPITIPEKDACDVDKKESLPSFSASSKCEIAMSPGSRERESKRRVVEGDVKGDSAWEAPDLHSEQRQVKDTHDISVYSDEGFCQETCASVLPDPDTDASPDEYLLLLTKALIGKDLEAKPALSLDSFFYEVTEEQMAAYTMEVVNSVRNNDLVLLKKLHQEGQALDCFNRFGESLLNMACRRGFESIAMYLLENDRVDVRICDDGGRTPLHDACWNPLPQLKICQGIIEREPSLLFVADRRGCTAFQYARKEHWDQWRKFLYENRECLLKLKHPDILSKFAKC